MKQDQSGKIKTATLNETNFDIGNCTGNVRKLSSTTASVSLSNETDSKTTMERLTPDTTTTTTKPKKLLPSSSSLSSTANRADNLLLNSLNDSCSLTTSPLTAQQYKKVVVPELTSPMKISFDDLAIDSKSLLNEIDSRSCPDGNVLRKVASITAGSLGIRPINEYTGSNLSTGSGLISTGQRKETKINFKSLLNGCKFDLKSLEKFEGKIQIIFLSD